MWLYTDNGSEIYASTYPLGMNVEHLESSQNLYLMCLKWEGERGRGREAARAT